MLLFSLTPQDVVIEDCPLGDVERCTNGGVEGYVCATLIDLDLEPSLGGRHECETYLNLQGFQDDNGG